MINTKIMTHQKKVNSGLHDILMHIAPCIKIFPTL